MKLQTAKIFRFVLWLVIFLFLGFMLIGCGSVTNDSNNDPHYLGPKLKPLPVGFIAYNVSSSNFASTSMMLYKASGEPWLGLVMSNVAPEAFMSWSPSSKLLSYMCRVGDDFHYLAVVDDHGQDQVVFYNATPGSWSPKEDLLIYGVENDGLYRYRLSSETERFYQSDENCTDQFPVFSPDATQIAFVRWTSENHYQIMIIGANGADPRLICQGDSFIEFEPLCLQWLPRCEQLLFKVNNIGAFVVNAQSAPAQPHLVINNGDIDRIYLSPDAKVVMYFGNRIIANPRKLYLVNCDTWLENQIIKVNERITDVCWCPKTNPRDLAMLAPSGIYIYRLHESSYEQMKATENGGWYGNISWTTNYQPS